MQRRWVLINFPVFTELLANLCESVRGIGQSERLKEITHCLQNFLLAVLLSRFLGIFSLHPAGIAFALYSRKLTFFQELSLISGFLVGTSSHGDYVLALKLTGAVILYKLVRYWVKPVWLHRNRWFLPLLWLGMRLMVSLIPPEVNGLAIVLTECLLVGLLSQVYQMAFKYIAYPLTSSSLAAGSLLVMIMMVICGAQDLSVYSIDISEMLSVTFLAMVAYLGGGGAGAMVGILIGWVLSLTAGSFLMLIAVYAIPGMLGGFLRGLGRWGTIVGGTLGLYLLIAQLGGESEIAGHAWSVGMGLAGFMMIPRHHLSQISGCFPEVASKEEAEQKQLHLEELVTTRLNEVSAAFAEISQTLSERETSTPPARTDLYSLLDQVCSQICQHCTGYENCWGENFYQTYRELFDLIAHAELQGEIHAPHVKGRLSKNCFQQFKLVNTINQLLENSQSDNYWRRKLAENTQLMIGQMQGISGLVQKLGEQITRDSIFKSELETKIKSGLNRAGIYVKEIGVSSFGEDGLEVYVKRRNCNQRHECQHVMVPFISTLLGLEFIVWEKKCSLGKDECAYCLIPKRTYGVKTTVCKLPKAGNEFSGDSHALHELKDGYFVAILSDGMGHGSRAASESNSTVTILEQLLDTGIDRNFAVKMVNSMMSLRSPEESFATVDLAWIDLYSGAAEFLKIGAAATYVKRGREVLTIKSTSLPAGILNTVDIEKTAINLLPGDLVVMVTDGVIDSKLDVSGNDEWMKRALSKVEVVGPEALGEYLLNLAKINQDGLPKDDMTVIVLQLTESKVYTD